MNEDSRDAGKVCLPALGLYEGLSPPKAAAWEESIPRSDRVGGRSSPRAEYLEISSADRLSAFTCTAEMVCENLVQISDK